MAFDMYSTEKDETYHFDTEALAKQFATTMFGPIMVVTWEPGEADGIQYGYYESFYDNIPVRSVWLELVELPD